MNPRPVPHFDDLWRRFREPGADQASLLPELLRVISEEGLTAAQLAEISTTPGVQFLSERPLVDGNLPPARRAE